MPFNIIDLPLTEKSAEISDRQVSKKVHLLLICLKNIILVSECSNIYFEKVAHSLSSRSFQQTQDLLLVSWTHMFLRVHRNVADNPSLHRKHYSKYSTYQSWPENLNASTFIGWFATESAPDILVTTAVNVRSVTSPSASACSIINI